MTNLRARILACLAAAAVFAVPAAAQQEPVEDQDPGSIVVTGEKPPASEINRQARDITASSGSLLRNPLARIEERLCPGIMGLKTDAAQLMIDRIRWNAERLDMWLADDADCTPNLIVAFVHDGQAEIAALEREHGYAFRTLTLPERRALLEEEGPVRVWTTAVTKTRDGMPVDQQDSLFAPPVVSMWMAHSKIYLPIRKDIAQVVVLFDREGVRGKSLIQLADYATMRGFARTKPADGDATLDTILTLFVPEGAPPSGMTDFDLAYLRSLYDDIPNLRGAAKIGGVSRELGQVLEEKAERE